MLRSNEINMMLTDKDGKNVMHHGVINCNVWVVEFCTLWDSEWKVLWNMTDSKWKDPGDYITNSTRSQLASSMLNGFDYVWLEDEIGLRGFLQNRNPNEQSWVQKNTLLHCAVAAKSLVMVR